MYTAFLYMDWNKPFVRPVGQALEKVAALF